jgi:hypothetical protein
LKAIGTTIRRIAVTSSVLMGGLQGGDDRIRTGE